MRAADPASTTRIICRLEAPPEAVFDAWTDPSQMRRWMVKSPDNHIEKVTVDLRVGGRFSILERASDALLDQSGTFREIDRPRRLALTLEVPRYFKGVTQLLVEIAPHEGGSSMRFTQTGVDPKVVEGSWKTMFKALSRLLKENAANKMAP